MALNSSAPISLAGSTTGQSIAIELGQSSAGTISLNDTNVRTLAGVTGSGTTIVMPTNFYGKSNAPTLGFSNSNSIYTTYNPDTGADTTTSVFYLNQNGTISYYYDNSSGANPTYYYTPATSNYNTNYEFKIVLGGSYSPVPASCIVTIGVVAYGGGTNTSQQRNSGNWPTAFSYMDMNISGASYTVGYVQFFNGTSSALRTINSIIYIRNKSTLVEISRPIQLTALGSLI